LTAALRADFFAVNRDQDGPGRLTSPPADLRPVLARIAAEPEGRHRWEGEDSPTPATLALAWWTDHLGRVHVRFAGSAHAGPPPGSAPRSPPDLPPLASVYPRRTVARHRGKRMQLLCVCPCGAWGPTDRLLWMGDHCGACHDRLQSGE